MPHQKTTTDIWVLINIAEPDACWEWQGYRTHAGYGRVRYNGKRFRAHRLVFELIHGYCPEVVRHRCDNPPCCNPAHLLPGTHQDNVRDCIQRGRRRHISHPGIRPSNTKLTAEIVTCIRARYAAKEANQYELAREYGVAQTTISKIILYKKWRDQPEPAAVAD